MVTLYKKGVDFEANGQLREFTDTYFKAINIQRYANKRELFFFFFIII